MATSTVMIRPPAPIVDCMLLSAVTKVVRVFVRTLKVMGILGSAVGTWS